MGVILFRIGATNGRLSRLPVLLPLASLLFIALPRDQVALGLIWIALLFPAALAIGGSWQAQGRMLSICRRMGDLSYGIYILHAPLVLVQTGVAKALLGPGWEAHKALIGGSIIVTVLAASWIATYWFDFPLRRFLRGRSARRAASGVAG